MSEDKESGPFLNSALQRFMCELYYRFGSFLAPLNVGADIICQNRMVLKMAEQIEMTDLKKETREQPVTQGKYSGFGLQ